jgi:hypothetical protein
MREELAGSEAGPDWTAVLGGVEGWLGGGCGVCLLPQRLCILLLSPFNQQIAISAGGFFELEGAFTVGRRPALHRMPHVLALSPHLAASLPMISIEYSLHTEL